MSLLLNLLRQLLEYYGVPPEQLVQNLNSLESEQSSTVAPSLADVLWMAGDREPSARFRQVKLTFFSINRLYWN
ncbi:hypothetical protein lerEdw1_018056 [Lerista edwardsae]|nr:hypothetical protein lerEdw1_018056 [Lerista edwardsae]